MKGKLNINNHDMWVIDALHGESLVDCIDEYQKSLYKHDVNSYGFVTDDHVHNLCKFFFERETLLLKKK